MRFLTLPAITTGVDILRSHIGHDRAYRVIHRRDVETVRAKEDDVDLLAGRQRADLAVEAVRPRALDRSPDIACRLEGGNTWSGDPPDAAR